MTNFGKATLKSGLTAMVATVALVATAAPAVAQEGSARRSAQEATWAAERAARNARAQNPQYRQQQNRTQQNRQPQYRGPVRNDDQRSARQSAYDARVAAERAQRSAQGQNSRYQYQGSRADEYRARDSAAAATRAARNAGSRARYENQRIEQRWNSNWRNDRRYNWSGYRNQYRDRYRMPTYYSPYRGRSYSRVSIGINLNSGYYGSRYWINDPYQYRLPPAPYGARWVRYYNDVVLVDMRSGYVMDVIRNFFW